jgi:hypothetical protein
MQLITKPIASSAVKILKYVRLELTNNLYLKNYKHRILDPSIYSTKIKIAAGGTEAYS